MATGLYPRGDEPETGRRVPSPPCGIATGTPIFANAPCGVERVYLLGFFHPKSHKFLMHRMELKDECKKANKSANGKVPNVPLGVENVELKEKGLNF
jgi:hypothetical protein